MRPRGVYISRHAPDTLKVVASQCREEGGRKPQLLLTHSDPDLDPTCTHSARSRQHHAGPECGSVALPSPAHG